MSDSPICQEHLEMLPSPVPGVDIWMAPIEPDSRKLDYLAALLSTDERARATRPIRDAGYRRFTAARGLLREILGQYIGGDPSSIRFDYGIAGKPRLRDSDGDRHLHFNLSHSGGLALVVVSKDRNVGIDVEQVTHGRDLAALGEWVLTRREWTDWSSTSREFQTTMFYRFWVRKEAYLKGIGAGLTRPMQSIDVSRTVIRSDRVVTLPVADERPVPWTIHDLEVPGGDDRLIAALAVENDPLSSGPISSANGIREGALKLVDSTEEEIL
jgi:4'-phosphopantetheinyl transferase